MPVQVTDFSRSYVRWSIDADPADQRTPGHMPWGNSVRLPIDARCSINNQFGRNHRDLPDCSVPERVDVPGDMI